MTGALLALLLAGRISAAPGAAGFDQRLGALLPADVRLRDGRAAPAPLSALLRGRPALFVPVYFSCPMLCPSQLEGLVRTLRVMSPSVGRDFDVFVYSFDPADGPQEAEKRRARLAGDYRRPGTEAGWHVLTGDARAVARLDEALGARPEKTARGEFAHAPGVVVVSPEGRATRYFFSLEPPARDLTLALSEASDGRVGGLAGRALLLCLRYDPASGRYTLAILEALRLAAGATVALLAGAAFFAYRRRA